jgi:hypothetical protein
VQKLLGIQQSVNAFGYRAGSRLTPGISGAHEPLIIKNSLIARPLHAGRWAAPFT